MDKQQIIAALVPIYNAAYDEYFRLSKLSIELIKEDEYPAYRTIARKAAQKSHFMDGIKSAAEALGITTDEFLVEAAYQNYQKGTEGDKCQEE